MVIVASYIGDGPSLMKSTFFQQKKRQKKGEY